MIVTTAELTRLMALLRPYRNEPITKAVIELALVIARREVASHDRR